MIKKEDRCANNPEISLTTEIGEHVPCRYSISTIWTLDSIENKHDIVYIVDNIVWKNFEFL